MAQEIGGGEVSSGRELRACRLGGLRVSEIEVPARLRLGQHAHRTAQICFVLEGRYRESWSRRQRRLSPGDAFYRPPGLRHGNLFGGEDALTLVVSVEPQRLPAVSPPLPHPLDRPMVRWLRDEVRRELRREDAATAHALEGLCLLLMAEVARAAGASACGPSAPDWLRHAESLIESDFPRPVTLAGLAGRVGVHRATLAAAFRRHLGCSVGERLREVRMRNAQRLLATSRMPLAEVAAACGFADQSHLGRTLRRNLGATPGQLRRAGASHRGGGA